MREVKVITTVTSCSQCPHWSEKRIYTADSFEMPFEWTCNHGGEKRKISGYVEWHDNVEIPVWCPFNEGNLNKKV